MQLAKDLFAIVKSVLKVVRTFVHYIELGVGFIVKALDKIIAKEEQNVEPTDPANPA